MEIYHWLRAIAAHLALSKYVSDAIVSLLLAAFLGGLIGLEREIARKPAGLRTNLFICFGSALFTILSFRYSNMTVDHNRISAQIIPGIGFIGAGSILRDKANVTGLTTAATLFVVASIGMAAGGGEYVLAIVGTLIILVGLEVLGRFENRFSYKPVLMEYEVAGDDMEKVMSCVNQTMDDQRLLLAQLRVGGDQGNHRMHFTVDATWRQHRALLAKLKATNLFTRVEMWRGTERE